MAKGACYGHQGEEERHPSWLGPPTAVTKGNSTAGEGPEAGWCQHH